MQEKEVIDLKEFLPQVIFTESQKGIIPKVDIKENEITISYTIPGFNNSTRTYSGTIQRYIAKTEKTFEVLGLLQAEMGKTQNGNLSFANHEYHIINRVIAWFKKEFEFQPHHWRWSIKLNIQEPMDENYRKEIEEKVINHWSAKTAISKEQAFPKIVTYIKNTPNTRLKFYDKGTLVLEYKNNLFSQIIKYFVKTITYEKILTYKKEHIRGYMRGIIAGEGCVECSKKDMKYRVHISVTKIEEKEIYFQCLKMINILGKIYPEDKLVISERENNIQLLKQRMMTISPEKYNKFLVMMQQYSNISQETEYFTGSRKTWNKIPQEKKDRIIKLYQQGMIVFDIALQTQISEITIRRMLREAKLTKTVPRTSEEKKKEIIIFVKNHKEWTIEKVAQQMNVHDSVIRRLCKKHSIDRGNTARCSIPQEKIQKILEIYQQNPTAKVRDICTELGVNDSVVKRVRREHNITHLGYKHLIGCNNK
ncbi:MAG TPA: hypothetical protein VJB87_00280 [Candidatus Nanoarchaeia archaeon]|nr:hypothetical protein [Candidatus Nanoarchaeia archaeon]